MVFESESAYDFKLFRSSKCQMQIRDTRLHFPMLNLLENAKHILQKQNIRSDSIFNYFS